MMGGCKKEPCKNMKPKYTYSIVNLMDAVYGYMEGVYTKENIFVLDTETEEICDLMDLSLSDIKDNAEDYVVILKTEREVRYDI